MCEINSTTIHDPTHAFIKIRYPIQSLCKRPTLPVFKPLNDIYQMMSSSKSPTIISKPEEIIQSASTLKNVSSVRSASSARSVTSLPITQPETNPTVNASFISDLNIPDGTLITPKKSFIKMWKVKNTGNVDWPIGSHLLFNGGSILRPYPIARPDCFAVPVINPDEETCITAELQAPDSPGNYTSYFCLCTPDGQRFGDNLWCTIKVDEDLEPEKKPNSIMNESTPSLAASIMMNSSTMIYPTPSTATSVSDHHARDEDGLSESTTGHNTTATFTDSQISTDDRDDFADEEYNSESTDAHSFTMSVPDELDDFVMVDEDSFEENVSSESAISSSNNTVTARSSQSPSRRDSVIYQSQLTQLHEMVSR
jgi:hypothetical protein